MRRFPTLFLISLLLLALIPAAAQASLQEYYTYGGFDPVSSAFNNIASMFGDSSYAGFIYVFALTGVFFAVVMAVSSAAHGKWDLWGLIISIIPGLLIWLSLFIPKTSIAIYDPVYNQNTVVDNLPKGVVYFSSMVNHFERWIIEITDTNALLPPSTSCGYSLSPMNYADNGGMVAPRLLGKTSSSYVADSAASQTMSAYIDDCVMFELNNPGGTITMDELISPGCNVTMMDTLAGAKSTANSSVNYMVNKPMGDPQTCSDVYDALKTFYAASGNSNSAVSNACAGASFTDKVKCQEMMASSIQNAMGIALSPDQYISNNTIAQITQQTLLTAGAPTSAAMQINMQMANNGNAGGIITSIANPYMIDAYVAYSILLFPFLAMLLVTPMWKTAGAFMLSLLFWTTLLRGLDVIIFHMWAIYYQREMVAALGDAGHGILASMQLPSLVNTNLGSFANLRSSAFLLATVISGALFKFGDSSLSRIASQHSEDRKGVSEAMTDPGKAAKMAHEVGTSAARATLAQSLAHGSGMANLGTGSAWNEMSSGFKGHGEFMGAGGGAPGGGAATAGGNVGHAAETKTAQEVGGANQVSADQAHRTGQVTAETKTASTNGFVAATNVATGGSSTSSTSGAGTAAFNNDGNLVNVKDTAAAGASLTAQQATQQQQQLSTAQAEKESASNSVNTNLSSVKMDEKGSTVTDSKGNAVNLSDTQKTAVSHAIKSATTEAISKGADITDSRGNKVSEEDRLSVSAGVSSGAMKIIGMDWDAKMGRVATVQTGKDTTAKVSMSGSSGKAFEDSFNKTISSDHTVSAAKNYGHSESDSKGHKDQFSQTVQSAAAYTASNERVNQISSAISDSKSNSAQTSANLETAAVQWWADSKHGGHDQDKVEKSMNEMREMAKAEPKQFQAEMQNFIKGQDYAPAKQVDNAPTPVAPSREAPENTYMNDSKALTESAPKEKEALGFQNSFEPVGDQKGTYSKVMTQLKNSHVANKSGAHKGVGDNARKDLEKDYNAQPDTPESALATRTANLLGANIGSNAHKAQEGDHGDSLGKRVGDASYSVGQEVVDGLKSGLGIIAGGKPDPDLAKNMGDTFRGNLNYTEPKAESVKVALDKFNKPKEGRST